VSWHPSAQPGKEAQSRLRLHPFEVDDFGAVEDGKVDGFVGGVAEPFEDGVGDFPELNAVHDQGAKLVEVDAEAILATGYRFEKSLGRQRADQAVDDALGQTEPPSQFGRAEHPVGVAELVEHVQGVGDGAGGAAGREMTLSGHRSTPNDEVLLAGK
jgi:hypothetical protein